MHGIEQKDWYAVSHGDHQRHFRAIREEGITVGVCSRPRGNLYSIGMDLLRDGELCFSEAKLTEEKGPVLTHMLLFIPNVEARIQSVAAAADSPFARAYARA